MGPHTTPPDRGQATLMMLAFVALVALVMVAVGATGRRMVHHGTARAAADAGALAAAVQGCAGAGRVVAANGATLVSCSDDGVDVVVRVRLDDVVAAARATRAP